MFPKFLLKKMYVKSSLHNTATGFQFVIINKIASGTILAVNTLKVDDESIDLKNVAANATDGFRIVLNEIKQPIPFVKGKEITFVIQGKLLAIGEHKISIELDTKEVGHLNFDFSDVIQ